VQAGYPSSTVFTTNVLGGGTPHPKGRGQPASTSGTHPFPDGEGREGGAGIMVVPRGEDEGSGPVQLRKCASAEEGHGGEQTSICVHTKLLGADGSGGTGTRRSPRAPGPGGTRPRLRPRGRVESIAGRLRGDRDCPVYRREHAPVRRAFARVTTSPARGYVHTPTRPSSQETQQALGAGTCTTGLHARHRRVPGRASSSSSRAAQSREHPHDRPATGERSARIGHRATPRARGQARHGRSALRAVTATQRAADPRASYPKKRRHSPPG